MELIYSLWHLLLEMSPFLLLGFFVSGLLSVLITADTISKYLGSSRFKSIFLASLFGVPLPLCSCGVIPVFSYLKKHGASKGAATSFLISTPQTGVDSILVTYGLLGPIFAIFRPVVALISGILGGFFVSISEKDLDEDSPVSDCNDECCDNNKSKLYQIFNYGFIKLVQDIASPLVIGIIFAALIFYFIPNSYFSELGIGTGLVGMLIMLLIGLPSYICATASVPIAFALHQSGFSMGALIVFLMSGPATNIATISVAIKQLGKSSAAIYVFTIIVCSIVAGLVFDYAFPPSEFRIGESLNSVMHMHSPFQVVSAIILISVIINAYRVYYFPSTISNVMGSNAICISGMTCNHCVDSITKSLNKMPNVKVLSIDLKSGIANMSCSDKDIEKIKKEIINLGFEIKK